MYSNSIRTLVSHILVNECMEHIIFIYQTSVYIIIRNRTSKEVFSATQIKFKTFEEAKGYNHGYRDAYSLFDVTTHMETVNLDGYTLKEYM